jgi:2-dehydropantoate 2-reductase
LGCLLAALLSEAGQDAALVDYRPHRAARLRQQGIRYRTLDGQDRQAAVAVGLPQEMGPRDLVIVAVKAYHTEAAARALPHLMAAGSVALTLQNGLGNLEAMALAVGPERLAAGVGLLGVTRQEEGQVVHAGAGPIFLGRPLDSQVTGAELAEVARIFQRAGLDCQVRDDIDAVLWEKLLVNVGINPLTALLRVPNGALLELSDAWEVALAAATEAKAVALASGLALTADPDAALRRVCTNTARNRSSMLQDVLAGRPTEIMALNGQVVQRGQPLGVPTPVNALLTRLVTALSQSAALRVS